jgi:hypothetical protein
MIAPRILRVGEEPPALEGDTPRHQHPKASKVKGKTGERFKTLNAFTDFTLANLDRAEIVAWLLLWRDTKGDGLARTSQADLARRAGVTDRTIRRALVRLRCRGLLTVVVRGGLLRGSSTYRVHGLERRP